MTEKRQVEDSGEQNGAAAADSSSSSKRRRWGDSTAAGAGAPVVEASGFVAPPGGLPAPTGMV